MERVNIIEAGDNYIYVVDCGSRCAFVVDPGESEPVIQFLQENRMQLIAALITHHHHDHIGGIRELKKQTNCQVIASDPMRLDFADRIVAGFDDFYMGNIYIKVFATPGHTKASVCYFAKTQDEEQMVFTGDTLFVNGCGRLFECTAVDMRKSLMSLADLDDETLVYCGHDYTVENYEFALSITPDDVELRERLEEVRFVSPTVPSTIGIEKRFNPFLNADDPEIIQALGMEGGGYDMVFTELRRKKDAF